MIYPDYPFAPHYHSINNQRLHYLDEGCQTTDNIVMLHGNPAWSFFYRKLVLALRKKYRCIVPDYIGMGLSDKPDNASYQYTLNQRIDDLCCLLKHLQITDNISLVLHGWGGMIGMAYATRYPQSIKRLIFLNTTAFPVPEGKKIPWQVQVSRVPVLGAILNQGFNAFAKGAIKKCIAGDPMTAEVAAAYLAPYNSWKNRRAIQNFIRDVPLSQNDPAWGTVNKVDQSLSQFSITPMLICWGMQDFIFDPIFLQHWQKRFMHAEVHCLEKAGHYVLEDAPEEVITRVQKFLRAYPL